MAQLTAQIALGLAPDQAAELARVMELQACWENLRDDSDTSHANGPGLRERQRRYDAFRSALTTYTARHKSASLPELTLNAPERVGAWCRAVRIVCERAGAEAEAPVHVVGKAYRLADRIAARLKVEPAAREDQVEGMYAAIRALDAIIAWCDRLSVSRGGIGPVVNHQSPPADVVGFIGVVHEPVAAKAA